MKKSILITGLFITSLYSRAQYVGIGTAVPVTTLDVNSAVPFTTKFNGQT